MPQHSSRIYLRQTSLQKNINFIREQIGEECEICSVVKANAYGHGIKPFVAMAERCGVGRFAVASAFEAAEVHEQVHGETDIMIMGILYDADLEWVIHNELEFFVFDYDRLPQIVQVAKQVGKPAHIHIEVETGTNRTGMNYEDFKSAITYLKEHRETLKFVGLCTHLGGAETLATKFRVDKQIERFKEFDRIVKRRNFEPTYRHVACSAAIFNYPQTLYDMVRVGILQYGHWPSPETYHIYKEHGREKSKRRLHRVLSWKTDVMDIKAVKEGEFIGYGTSYQAHRDMQIAVLPLGYSNGYARGLSNKGYVLIKGKKAPIVGMVNMNLFMVNVTHIPGVEIGEEVVLIGRQKNGHITISSFSNVTHQLNNELLSRLPEAIPRKVVE